MRGEPKHLNSKFDYEYLKENYPEDIWRPAFQRLYDDRMREFNAGVLADGDSGIVDDTHSVIESKDMTSDAVIRYQYEMAVNPDAHMFRIGYTEEEILTLLGSVI